MNAGETHILRAWGDAGLLRAGTDSSVLACAERVLGRANDADRVVLIADESGERRAAALGLRTPLVVPPAVLRTPRLRDGLRRVLARTERPTQLVCWDSDLLHRARASARGAWSGSINAVDGRDLRQAESPRRRLPAGDRDSMRNWLGLPRAEHVLILASDPPDALSAQDFIRTCALVALVGRDVTAIVPRQSPEMERAKATLRNTGIPLRLLTCEAPMWTLLPCADAVVLDVLEGGLPRNPPFHSRRFLAATCASMEIPVVWPESDLFGDSRLDPWVLRPRSRLAVHVARAINEHFLASAKAPLVATIARREVPA